MTIAKIRKGNRITIPVEEMKKKQLSEGDEVYFEVSGKIGRDVFISAESYGTNGSAGNGFTGSSVTSGTLYGSGTQPWNSY